VKVYIWDWPLRIFHWLLVIMVALAYLSTILSSYWLEWHLIIGLIILSLFVFRMIWGFLGSYYAQFSQFLFRKNRDNDLDGLGHSYHGGISVFVMLVHILLLSITGVFSYSEETELAGQLYFLASGELADFMSYWHALLFDSLVVFVLFHLVAIFYYDIFLRKNLVGTMIFGYKNIHSNLIKVPKLKVKKINLALSLAFSFAMIAFIYNAEAISNLCNKEKTNSINVKQQNW